MAIRFIDEEPKKSKIRMLDEEAEQISAEPTARPEPTFRDRLQAAAQATGGVLSALNPLPTAEGVKPKAELLKAVLGGSDIAGEAVAENLASGVNLRQIPGIPGSVPLPAEPGQGDVQLPPEIAAGAGLATSILPEAVGLAEAKGPVNLAKAIRGRLSKEAVGGRIRELESAAGIKRLASDPKRVASGLGLPENAKLPDIINAINEIKSQGGQIAKQTSRDFLNLVDRLKKQGKVVFEGVDGELLTEARQFARQQLNQAIPGLADEVSRFATLSKIGRGAQRVGRLARNIGIGAAGVGGTAALLNALR